jgi:mRNA interferase RelE/StbE
MCVMDVRYSMRAAKALIRSNKRQLIRAKIDAFAATPDDMAANVIRMQGRAEFRLRVQDWRVIFRIEAGEMLIDDIAPRGAVYEVTK